MKKVDICMVSILAVALLIATCCYADNMVSGIVTSFDAKTGRLIMQTSSQSEATFSIPQSVKVYLRADGKDIEFADSWQFLRDNLMQGTKVQMLRIEGSVITIWILEVPR
jgi:hypothetical protein